MISIKILIITGVASYPILKKVIEPIKEHDIEVRKAPVSIAAFLSEDMVKNILKELPLIEYDIALLPGFVQWDAKNLESESSIKIRKGPEFASDLPWILKNLEKVELSNSIPVNKLFIIKGEVECNQIEKEQKNIAKTQLGHHTFYINEKISDIMVGRNLNPPIIAEIVNCTEKSDKNILKKAKHYINSGADVIDIGCVAYKPYPERVREIIKLIRNTFNVLISIDSMDTQEILSAVDEGIDLILSLDLSNYEEFVNIPKDIPIVIIPTKIKAGYFPKDPKERIKNLLILTKKMYDIGFKKLIADPLLETPIAPGICNSLEAYFLYKKKVAEKENKALELPLFFGISNVVELMDIDSVGVNGLLSSIAIELDIGILFTVEHSTKLMGGVAELKQCLNLNYLAKYKNSPPINHGIQIFKAKGKISQNTPKIDNNMILVENLNKSYVPDENGYFKIYVNHYSKKIIVLFFSINHELIITYIGINSEVLSKEIIKNNLTNNIYHLNYLGRELSKAEICLNMGKPYIQDE